MYYANTFLENDIEKLRTEQKELQQGREGEVMPPKEYDTCPICGSNRIRKNAEYAKSFIHCDKCQSYCWEEEWPEMQKV